MNRVKIEWEEECGYHTTNAFGWRFSVYSNELGKFTWTQTAPGLCMDMELAKYNTLEEAKQACENKIYKYIEDFLKE